MPASLLRMGSNPDKGHSFTRRLVGLPRQTVVGIDVPVATSTAARLLGLSHLDCRDAGPGLLIPGCRSVHTFGMRFPIDIFFLDESGAVVRCCPGVRPGRCLFTKRARSVLELVPVRHQGGEDLFPAA